MSSFVGKQGTGRAETVADQNRATLRKQQYIGFPNIHVEV